MCNCGKSSGRAAEEYVVTRGDGKKETFATKVAADIAVTKHGGSYVVNRK